MFISKSIMKSEKTKNQAIGFIVLAIITLMFLPLLFQRGMFLDGITYAAIARNLSLGIGDFWHPHYTETISQVFYGHPPLAFGIQSFFFDLLGDNFYEERLYSLFTFFLTGLGIILTWRIHFRDKKEYLIYWWLPILIWLLFPLTAWAYANNILENTLSVFTVFAVYFIYRGMLFSLYVQLFLGTICLVLAILSKGTTGLFPLIFPIIFITIDFSKLKKAISFLLFILTGFVLIGITICFLFPASYSFITTYMEIQLIPALTNQGELTTTMRGTILIKLLEELALPIGITCISLLLYRYISNSWSVKLDQKTIFFLLIALCASIPLIITLKQRRFYLLPSLPFYALAVATFIIPVVQYLVRMMPLRIFRAVKYFSVVMILGTSVYSISNYGQISRDREYIEPSSLLAKYLVSGSTLSTDESLCENWILIAYLSRHGNLNLDCDNNHKYLLLRKDVPLSEAQSHMYYLDSLQLPGFKLYKRV